MPQIGREQVESGLRVLARPIGVEQGAYREAVAQIMDPRATGRGPGVRPAWCTNR